MAQSDPDPTLEALRVARVGAPSTEPQGGRRVTEIELRPGERMSLLGEQSVRVVQLRGVQSCSSCGARAPALYLGDTHTMERDDGMETDRNQDAAPRAGRKRDILSFGLNFVKRPAMLGAVLPSSRYLVRRALKWIDWSRAELIVEYGPGVGTFTGEILRRMRSDARLLAFETNPDFVRRLRAALPDPRLEVKNESAERVETVVQEQGARPVDYVLSGIPFSLMPPESRDAILRSTNAVLAPDGAMLVYQYRAQIRSHLERTFLDVQAEFEPRNFPPANVFYCNRRPV